MFLFFFFLQSPSCVRERHKDAISGGGGARGIFFSILNETVHFTYSSELGCKRFVYDGGKTLYTVGPLPLNKYEFNVLLEKSFTKRYVMCMTVLFASCFIFPLNLTVPTLAVVPRVLVLTEAFMRKVKGQNVLFCQRHSWWR